MPVARAPHEDPVTVGGVPRSRPPQRTKNGSLRAVPVQPSERSRQLPIRQANFDRELATGPGPLAGLKPSTVFDPTECVSTTGKLDKGRLSAGDLVKAAGWGPSMPLVAQLCGPHRVRLSPAIVARGPVAGSLLVHTDAAARIVVSTGLRSHLGIGPTDAVVAWTNGCGIVELAPAAMVGQAFAALDQSSRHPSQHPLLTAVATA